MEITKSPSSVSELSSTVVSITESPGASVKVSKLPAVAEKSDSEKSNKLTCSIKVEDSPYALVDLNGIVPLVQRVKSKEA